MVRIAASIIVAGIAAAGTTHLALASNRPHLAGEVDILINGAPQPRYAHQGRWYIEAVKGHEYAIRLRNPYGVRVAVALSVDGLNTIDGQETTAADARKWVLGPYETVTISGWQISRAEARRFEFTTEEQSYGHALGKAANLGVISAVYFRERPRARLNESVKDVAGAAPRSPSPPAARAQEEYAATGMGRATDHAVTQVWLDLEPAPSKSVDIRYEFRPQPVRLGILPRRPAIDPLTRREGARGFEPGFAPEPMRRR